MPRLGPRAGACAPLVLVVVLVATATLVRVVADPGPPCPTAVVDHCLALAGGGQLDEAREVAEGLLRWPTPCAGGFFCAGAIAFLRGELREAIARFEGAVHVEPGNSLYWQNLGTARSRAGFLDGSVRAFAESVALDPTRAGPRMQLGHALLESNAFEAAVEHFHAALETPHLSVPDELSVRSQLAHALSSVGRNAEAERAVLAGVSRDAGLLLRLLSALVQPVPTSRGTILLTRARIAALIDVLRTRLRDGSLRSGRSASDTASDAAYDDTPPSAVAWIRDDTFRDSLPVRYAGDLLYLLTYHGYNDRPLREAYASLLLDAFPYLRVRAPTLNPHPAPPSASTSTSSPSTSSPSPSFEAAFWDAADVDHRPWWRSSVVHPAIVSPAEAFPSSVSALLSAASALVGDDVRRVDAPILLAERLWSELGPVDPRTATVERRQRQPAPSSSSSSPSSSSSSSSLSFSLSSARPLAQGRRLRACFLTAYFHKHSVSKMITRLMATLPRAHFVVVAIGMPGPEDDVARWIASQVDEFVHLPGAEDVGGRDPRRAVAEQACDVLVFPELGMASEPTLLAFARLAPVQVATHGNSLTGGIPDTVDYFVSFDAIEDDRTAEGSAAHYTEQLVRLDSFHSQFLAEFHLPDPFWEGEEELRDEQLRIRSAPRREDGTSSSSSSPLGPSGFPSRLANHATEERVRDSFEQTLASVLLQQRARQAADTWTDEDARLANLLVEADLRIEPVIESAEEHTRRRQQRAQRDLARALSLLGLPSCAASSLASSSSPSSSSSMGNATFPARPSFLCPQSLFKLHPDFDALLLSILVNEPCGRLLLLEGTNAAWDGLVARRLAFALQDLLYHAAPDEPPTPAPADPSIPSLSRARARGLVLRDVLQRAVFVPQRSHQDFLRLLAAADVVVDTYPFGGCTSSYEALLVGTPVVTLPSDALRGRFTQALLRQVHLPHLIAPNPHAFVHLVLQTGRAAAAQAPHERRKAQAALAAAARAAVRDERALHEWSRFLRRAVANAWSSEAFRALEHASSTVEAVHPAAATATPVAVAARNASSRAREGSTLAASPVRLSWVELESPRAGSLDAAVRWDVVQPLRDASTTHLCVVLDDSAPSCGVVDTQSGASGRWPLRAEGLAAGRHRVRVRAVEATEGTILGVLDSNVDIQ